MSNERVSESLTSREHLEALRRDGKISDEDYAVLQTAIEEERERLAESTAAAGRKLTRSWDKRLLGGVCAGLAERFGLAPWKVRALFLLFSPFGFGIIVTIAYITLFLVLPWDEPEKARGWRPTFPWKVLALVGGSWLAIFGMVAYIIPRHIATYYANVGHELPWAVRAFLSLVSPLEDGGAALAGFGAIAVLAALYAVIPEKTPFKDGLLRAICWALLSVLIAIAGWFVWSMWTVAGSVS